jgi:hypothetical protein
MTRGNYEKMIGFTDFIFKSFSSLPKLKYTAKGYIFTSFED